jgi:hypothetical protein
MEEDHGGITAGPLTLVRAGSAVDRQTTDNSGHQRSADVRRNRRSLNLQPPDLERRRGVQWSSSLPTPTIGAWSATRPFVLPRAAAGGGRPGDQLPTPAFLSSSRTIRRRAFSNAWPSSTDVFSTASIVPLKSRMSALRCSGVKSSSFV